MNAAMRELNYQPNTLAWSLQGKQTKMIGVIMPSITNPFFAELVAAIEDKLEADGYKMLLCDAGQDSDKERRYLRMLEANQVDGIIAGSHNLGIEEYQRYGLPIVSFDRYLSDQVPIVTSDNYQGGCLATQALVDAGCGHVYFVGNPVKTGNPTSRRFDGYADTVAAAGLTVHTARSAFYESPAAKARELRELLTSGRKIDGVFCSDDLTAILLLKEARKLGIRVPEDLKIVGFDGTQLVQNYVPELATVVQPVPDLAGTLVKLLYERIADPEKKLAQNSYLLPVKLLRNQTV
ncbi:LacI family DNA-binding transcriptional regulator [Lactobacillus delbrueckii subsp. bulgaricus]|uniref:LacI family DNA-binding transcriptional regulator n=2 Tax=Lactobacillus delbrueckii TaxID=1584 RepID=UPI001BFF6083|nr:LacI family DNA-binding transcriptional regulator [Lactobacillus delbrueckii]MBT8926241.1 transcriptional regulator [Lactobacillus delbrueckii subsp. bulgaricus]MBU6049613.1 LacI family DNA-binding transcriptional regulator [Lactobacillus delbrueckii]MCT3477512.1 LacI family transcriptional regulator [Lactobacillus delbrueckii subsp. bulgaricus]MCT3479902.1 LacI family transcriptional regulator [Lactobacillus delbrueckii subsp. bulgaricus]UUY36634.1 LacI family DNA-binding transcriptional r